MTVETKPLVNEEEYRVVLQGDLFQLSVRQPKGNKKATRAKRGSVRKFSHKSRKRMLELAARLNQTGIAHFVTLTYSDDIIPNDTRQLQAHLRAFLERLRRTSRFVSAIWRIEIEERKSGRWKGYAVPHFHLLVFNAHIGIPTPGHEHDSGWVHDNWAGVLSNYYGFDVAPRTDHSIVASSRAARKYVSKYSAKVADTDNLVYVPYLHEGRFWGVMNEEFLPFAERIEYTVKGSKRTFYAIRRSARRWNSKIVSKRQFEGFTIFSENAHQWFAYLSLLIGDDLTTGL